MIHEACDATREVAPSRAADLADRFLMEVGGVLLAADLCADGCRDATWGAQMGVIAARTLQLATSYPPTWSRICTLGGIPSLAEATAGAATATDDCASERSAITTDTARADALATLRIAALQVAVRMRELTDDQLERVVERRGPATPARSVEYLITAALIRRTHGHFERLLLLGC